MSISKYRTSSHRVFELNVCRLQHRPLVLFEQGADEIFGLVRDVLKALRVKLPAGCCHQSQCLCIAVPLERRLSAQPG